MAKNLVNNGLPDGIHFKDIKVGDILLVKWKDSEPGHAVVVGNNDSYRRKTYKGYVTFSIVDGKSGRLFSIDGDQVVKMVGSQIDYLLQLDKTLSEEEKAIRFE